MGCQAVLSFFSVDRSSSGNGEADATLKLIFCMLMAMAFALCCAKAVVVSVFLALPPLAGGLALDLADSIASFCEK